MKWYIKVLNQYADFEGRASRKEFWMFVLFNFLITLILAIICASIIALVENAYYALLLPVYSYMFAVLIPNYAVTVRRLHDIGKSGWCLFIGLIPLIGGIWLIVLLASKGMQEENRYGEQPKAQGDKIKFNKIKSVAIAMIVGAIFWIAVTILNYIVLNIKHVNIHSTFLLPILYSFGILIAGVSLLSNQKLTVGAAWILIVTSVVWIFSSLFDSYRSVNIPMPTIDLIISFFNVIIPISLLLFALFAAFNIGNRKTTAFFLQAGAILWVTIDIIIMIIWRNSSFDLFQILSMSSKIIIPVSLLLLTPLIRDSATIFKGNKST